MAGWGLCYTTTPSCQKADASGLPECSALRFSHSKGQDMKDGKTEDGGRSAARKWVTIRVTEREKNTPHGAGGNRRTVPVGIHAAAFFGGRPLVAHADLSTVAELRRIGGLLKHNFETLRQAKAPPDILERQEDALRNLVWAIQKISLRCHHDCQENQEYKG